MTNKLIRLSKLISHAGICSRKNAEFLIKNGDVKINDNVFKEFFIEKSLIKSIKVKDKPLTNIKTRVWILNKPVGYVSSNKEQFSQKSLFRLVPKDLPRVVSVGRLDIKSEGLLLLTTNPKLSSYLEDPSNKIERRYIVKVSGKIPENLDKLVEGQFLVDGILYNEIKIKHPDAMLLFRVGDFYETFGEDAILASKILGIVLTKRANGAASHVELAGFPHHSLNLYLPNFKLSSYSKAFKISKSFGDSILSMFKFLKFVSEF